MEEFYFLKSMKSLKSHILRNNLQYEYFLAFKLNFNSLLVRPRIQFLE